MLVLMIFNVCIRERVGQSVVQNSCVCVGVGVYVSVEEQSGVVDISTNKKIIKN